MGINVVICFTFGSWGLFIPRLIIPRAADKLKTDGALVPSITRRVLGCDKSPKVYISHFFLPPFRFFFFKCGQNGSMGSQTSCLNKSLVQKWFYGLEREKIIEYDFCSHREYLVAVSHKVKSFQFNKLAPLLQVLWKMCPLSRTVLNVLTFFADVLTVLFLTFFDISCWFIR